MLLAVLGTVGLTSRPAVSPRAHVRMTDELPAACLPTPVAETMLPGDYRWIRIVDDAAAATLSTARSQCAGLLAQRIGSGTTGAIVPLLRLMPSRTMSAGAFVEVACVGRGVWRGTATVDAQVNVSVHTDKPEMAPCITEMQDLKRLQTMCRKTSMQLAGLHVADKDAVPWGWPSALSGAGGSGGAVSDLEVFLRSPLEGLLEERRNALRRNALGANADSDAELLSYAACACLPPGARMRAVQCSSARERLLLCTAQLREHHNRLSARLALEQALSR